MSRDTWQVLRPAVQTTKIRKSLSLPAASYECFEDKGSIRMNIGPAGPLVAIQSTPASLEITSALTLEAWVYVEVFSNRILLGINSQYELRTTSAGKLRLSLYKGGAQTVISASTIPQFQWVHIAATWDGTTAYLFINGVQDANTLSLTPSLATGAGIPVLFGDGSWTGYGAEARIWDRALSIDELNFRRNHPLSDGSTLETGLICYWKCNEGSGTTVFNKTTTDLDFTVSALNSLKDDMYPPLIYGASFIVAETTVTLSKSVSLIYPKNIPSGCTGMLCASHLNDDGEEERFKLWDLAGVDIAPAPVAYTGQKLNSPFKLEWWNIDGELTVEVPAMTISISDTTNPSSSIDNTQIAAATLTIDTTIAEAFPLTFPLSFATQQTY